MRARWYDYFVLVAAAALSLLAPGGTIQEFQVGKCWQLERISDQRAVLVRSIPNGQELLEFDRSFGKTKRLPGWWEKASGGFELLASPKGGRLLFKEHRWILELRDVRIFGSTDAPSAGRKNSSPISHVNNLVVWTADGLAWYEIPSRIQRGMITVYRRDADGNRITKERWRPFDQVENLTGTVPAILTPRESLLILKEWLGLGHIVQKLVVFEIAASKKKHPVKIHSIPMPAEAHLWQSAVQNVALRFDRLGRRIACLLKLHPYNLRDDQRVEDLLAAPYELWIANLDGTGLRRIGKIPVRYTPLERDNGHIEDFEWLPNGTALSYLQREKLVIVNL